MPPPPSVQQRDRGLGLQRDLTVAVAIAAGGLLGVFAIVAATTIPGHSDAGAVASTGASQTGAGSSNTSFGGQSQFRHHDDQGGSFTQGGGSTTPIVVTGGSR